MLPRSPLFAFHWYLLLAAATAVVLVATHDFGSSGKTSPAVSTQPQAVGRVGDEPLHRLHDAWTSAGAAPATGGKPKRATKPKPKVTLVSSLQTVSAHTTPPATQTVAGAPAQSSGPAPLPPPTGASAPTPLKAP